MVQPLISVIIPVYNRATELDRCLTSLFDQTYPDLEIIVVDDQSTDDSKHIALKHKTVVIEGQHCGVGAARNLGAKSATGKILIFVDSDMTFHADFITQLIAPILAGDAIGTNTNEEYVMNDQAPLAVAFNYLYAGNPSRRVPLDQTNISPVFRAIRKVDFDRVGGFSGQGYNDDWSLSTKLKVNAVIAPHAIMYHKNPDTYDDIFTQSQFIGNRPYKLGWAGSIIALLRASLPISLITAISLTVKYRNHYIFSVKLISDLGICVGILKSFRSL